MFGTRSGTHKSTSRVYATWNPADKGNGVILTNGNLDVALSTSPHDGGSVRSTIGKTSGRWYWEVTALSGFALVGIANPTASIVSGTYYSAIYAATGNGFGLYAASGNLLNGGQFGYTTAFGSSTIIGVALDLVANTLRFYKDGIDLGIAASSLPATTWHAAEGNYTLDQPLSRANFGATAFTYTVPAGFNAGLYN
jgi:hypothetical protein